MQVLDKTLQASSYGILFLTPDNFDSKWIHFEAGAIAKATDASRVCPLLLDLNFSEIAGPLANFQAKKFDKEGVWDLCRSINNASAETIAEKNLSAAFDRAWPEIYTLVESVLRETSLCGLPQKPKAGPLDEILSICRNLTQRLERIEENLAPTLSASMNFEDDKRGSGVLWVPISSDAAKIHAEQHPDTPLKVSSPGSRPALTYGKFLKGFIHIHGDKATYLKRTGFF